MHSVLNIRSLWKDRARLLTVICTLVFFITASVYALGGPIFNPSGDEIHFLVISQTLLKYHSLNVMADYLHGDYHTISFYHSLDPHIAINVRHEVLPLHSIGGPILWLIPFFLFGRVGAVWFIAGLSVLIIFNIYRLLLAMGVREKTAFTVSLFYALASPIYIYAHLTFIEPIGAFICICVLRKIVENDTKISALIFSSTLLGILPWVHMRFAFLEIPLFFALLYRVYSTYKLNNFKRYFAYLLPVTILTCLLEIYSYVVWGTLNPAANQIYGNSKLFEVWPYQGLLGLLFDQNYGLLICFPLCLFLLAGIALATQKRYRSYNLLVLALSLPYIIAFTTFRHWGGGWCPPARFIMVLLPVYAFYIAYAIERLNNRLAILLINICFLWGLIYNILSLFPPYNGFSDGIGPNAILSSLHFHGHHLTDILPNVTFLNPIQITVWIILYIALSMLFVRWAKDAQQKEAYALEKETVNV